MLKQFVRALPSPDKVAEVKDLAKLGFDPADITVKVFGTSPNHAGGHQLVAVKAIIADAHGYDTDVDEVAVDRALQGDRAVWLSLTHYERREVMIRIHTRLEQERAENREDLAGFPGDRWSRKKGWPYIAPHERTPEWAELLAESFGWTARRLGQEAKDYAEARVL